MEEQVQVETILEEEEMGIETTDDVEIYNVREEEMEIGNGREEELVIDNKIEDEVEINIVSDQSINLNSDVTILSTEDIIFPATVSSNEIDEKVIIVDANEETIVPEVQFIVKESSQLNNLEESKSSFFLPKGISNISSPHTILFGGFFLSVMSFFLILSLTLRKRLASHRGVDLNDNTNNDQMRSVRSQAEHANVDMENIFSPENIPQEDEILEFMADAASAVISMEMENKRPARKSRIMNKEKEDTASMIKTRRSSKVLSVEPKNVPEPSFTRMSTRLRK